MVGPRAERPAGWRRLAAWACTGVLACAAVGCRLGEQTPTPPAAEPIELPGPQLNPDLTKTLAPSNDRDWVPDQARLAYAEFVGDLVTVHDIRNCTYQSADDYVVNYYDKTFDLKELTSVDFIVVPFNDMPGIAHTMLSFGFQDRDYLGVSVEIRKERGEKYDAMKGFLHQYELMYVVADERDLVQKRGIHEKSDVYIYRTRATPAQARALLVDVMQRVNQLVQHPEFYDTLTNNCTTNLRRHINRLVPDRVPYDYHVLLPGYSDRLAYDLGLLATDTTFEETRRRARVNYQAYVFRDAPDFSVRIRQGTGPERNDPTMTAGLPAGR